jgi:flagellin
MGFRVNNNIPALRVRVNLYKNQQGLVRSIERLSSGLRINRGEDDPSGLTIAEKLRSQIRGTNRAVSNAQDGISLIQTADGALGEHSEILNRLRELSIQAQSDALTVDDRIEIQKEVDLAVSEIDQLSASTEFNTRSLLDGTASALVSTDGENGRAFQTGGNIRPGEYKISVQRNSFGEKQEQKSGIQTDQNTGQIASLTTELRDLDSMFDSEGNSVLEDPITLTLRGNRRRTDLTISGDTTLQDFASNIESALQKDDSEGGLNMSGATFAFNSSTGQFIFEGGKDGRRGELSLAAGEDFLNGLAMQITVESRDPGFRVSATEAGVSSPETFSANTTSQRASGVLEGLVIGFDLAKEARLDGTVAGVQGLKVGNSDAVFTFHDTNSQDNGQTLGSITAGVTITLTSSRTFTLTSIESLINNAISAANDPTNPLTPPSTSSSYQNPGVTASFSGFDLILSSNATGTSGEISLTANGAAQTTLGLTPGKVTGTGGNTAIFTGTTDISAGVSIAGTGVLRIQLGDGDFNTGGPSSTTNDISFNRATLISSASITSEFNNYFTANNIKASASVNASGFLEILSTETGTDSRLSITSFAGGSLADLGLVDGQTDVGSGGLAASFSGDTNSSFEVESAFVLNSFMSFRASDETGVQTGTITFGTSNVSSSGESFAMSSTQVSSILSSSSLSSTDVDFGFDAGNRLDFFTRSPGTNSRVTLFSNIASQNTGLNAFGINFNSQAQGSGREEFNLHVSDRSMRFQIGANQGQQLRFPLANTSAESLGVEALDVTNIKAATRALAAIDSAVGQISTERSKLGSFQNRLNTTVDNLTSTTTNLAAAESQIRDVDIAKETVDFTRNQILVQAGTAQLIQANALGQTALTLLF